jgi:hypothetical protein
LSKRRRLSVARLRRPVRRGTISGTQRIHPAHRSLSSLRRPAGDPQDVARRTFSSSGSPSPPLESIAPVARDHEMVAPVPRPALTTPIVAEPIVAVRQHRLRAVAQYHNRRHTATRRRRRLTTRSSASRSLPALFQRVGRVVTLFPTRRPRSVGSADGAAADRDTLSSFGRAAAATRAAGTGACRCGDR